MDLPAWLTDLSLYHYLAIGGGAVIVLALLLYFTPVSRLKMPKSLEPPAEPDKSPPPAYDRIAKGAAGVDREP